MSTQQKLNKIEGFLKYYSLDDLAEGFFVLNLWLPNIASPIKIQYLYVVLESIYKDLSTKDKINSYEDFEIFCKKLFELLPSFAMLEDRIPEPDWGDIKYYFQKKFYKIFYGGDLSNPYDFYYAYEITHKAFEQEYLDLLKRSPMTELQFCLEAQNHILKYLRQDKTDVIENIIPGDIGIPSEYFWKAACEFLDKYDPSGDYNSEILEQYTKEFNEPMPFPSMKMFVENAYHGRNCKYFFLKNKSKYYPVIPRKWLTVIYDTWGVLLKNNYANIVKKLDKKEPSVLIGTKLAKFILDRVEEGNVFPLVRSVKPDLKTAHDLIFTAVHAGDNLFLIYVTPPYFNQKDLDEHLKEIQAKLKQSADIIRQPPTRLGLIVEQKIVEFISAKEEKALEPIFLIVLPSPLSDMEGSIAVPEGIEAEIMTLDQVAGIFDEIKKTKELSEFFDYLTKERELARITPLNSYLDRFGSFRDSYGVLVPGAIEPNRIMLDFSWGSNFRFKSLKEFWALFPEESFYGHPRSWTIPDDRKTKTGFILDSRTFFGYAYYQKIGQAAFFINAPVHRMALDDGRINDLIMQSLFDAINIYPHIIEKSDFTKHHNKTQVFFCPSSLAVKEGELAHVRHLVQNSDLWAMDCARMRSQDYGVRVIYNREKIIKALKDATDRSVQIRLLIDVLEQLNTLVPELNFANIKKELEKEKSKKARFKTFAVEKTVSFPEGIRTLLPDQREYKLADKEIAKIALELDIQPGTYSADEGKKKLNALRSKIVQVLDLKIKNYNLSNAISLLLKRGNALMHDSWHAEAEIKASRDHEVDYERSEKSSEREKKLLHWYRVYRYLIEKFVHLQPKGESRLNDQYLKELLTFADRLIDLYVASDFINYELYPINVNINRDYIVSTSDEKHDIASMGKEYGEEQAKLNLGIIGNKDDTADSSLSATDYLDELDSGFKKDFGFGLKNLVNFQQVLALWSVNAKKAEDTHYFATAGEISSVCAKSIKGYDISETDAILDFLTLKPEEIVTIKGAHQQAEDVPIWEHNKRLMRFDIRPLIKIDDQYCWGPHSIDRTGHIWVNISSRHRLPSNLGAPAVKAVLEKGHEDLGNSLVEKIKEITLRHTTNVKRNVYPHKHDSSIKDIGDYDVLAYLKDKNILLNIESKIIDPPHSNKDAGRVQRKIFGEIKEDGTTKRGYLQRVEERAKYLNSKGKNLITKLGWDAPSEDPKVVSLFVTKMGFWWTKFPPIETEVRFAETRLLNNLIKNL